MRFSERIAFCYLLSNLTNILSVSNLLQNVLTAQQTLLPIRVDNKNSRNILIFVFFQILTMFPIARIIETTSPTVRQERTPFSPMGNPLCCASTVPKAPVYSAARFRPTQFCCMGSTFARPAARRWGNKASIKSKAGHPRWMLCLFFVSVLLAGEPCLPLHFLWGNGFILPFSARAWIPRRF